MENTLIAYFSASGSTARLARTFAEATGGTLYEIQPEIPYTNADLNWNDRNSRSSLEMNDKSVRPLILEPVENMAQYDTIFLGFPIWWYEAPRIIQTFLESYDLHGKTVIPFATSGGSGMGKTSSILQKSCQAKVLSGKRMSPSASVNEVTFWINSLHL